MNKKTATAGTHCTYLGCASFLPSSTYLLFHRSPLAFRTPRLLTSVFSFPIHSTISFRAPTNRIRREKRGEKKERERETSGFDNTTIRTTLVVPPSTTTCTYNFSIFCLSSLSRFCGGAKRRNRESDSAAYLKFHALVNYPAAHKTLSSEARIKALRSKVRRKKRILKCKEGRKKWPLWLYKRAQILLIPFCTSI